MVLIFLENSNTATDEELSRKILGSSVVTSLSIMDNENSSRTVYTDVVGKPIDKPSNGAERASPINFLNPDRYEFYTYADNGDLVKCFISLHEIKLLQLIAMVKTLIAQRKNDVSDSWSMVLPAAFGSSGADIKPVHVTPDTIMLEPYSNNCIPNTKTGFHDFTSFDFNGYNSKNCIICDNR